MQEKNNIMLQNRFVLLTLLVNRDNITTQSDKNTLQRQRKEKQLHKTLNSTRSFASQGVKTFQLLISKMYIDNTFVWKSTI